MAGKKNGTGQELGKWFEAEVQKCLETLQQKQSATYQRLYDTASAGSFMPKQPGDFIVVYQGIPFLLEVKSSTRYQSLTDGGAMRSLIKDHQIAAQRVWHRAGAAGGFIFLGADKESVEFWDGFRVAETYKVPRKKLSDVGLQVGKIRSLYSDLSDFLQTSWLHYATKIAEAVDQEESCW